MAVNTRARRFSMMNMGRPGASRGPLTPDGSNLGAAQRAHILGMYSGIGAGAGPVVSGGTVAIFLDDSTAVPATAVFRHGAAFAQTGERYVALWPASGHVHYLGGFAHREDGALVIIDSGVTNTRIEGVSLTDRGEVLYSNGAATSFIMGQFQFGWRLNSAGAMCFTGP